MDDRVRIFNQSCPSLTDLLATLKHLPATRLGLPGISGPTDPAYAAVVWKGLFLVALERMGKQQESLARVTAAEALTLLHWFSSSTKYPASRGLAAMKRRVYSTGELKPRPGLHPDDLLLHYEEARKVLDRTPIAPENVVALWRKWEAGRLPADVVEQLRFRKTARARSIYLIARAFRYSEESVETLLSRYRKTTQFLNLRKGER